MDTVLELAANDGVQTLLVSFIGIIFAFIMKLGAVKKYNLERLAQLGKTAVMLTYEDFVKVRKKHGAWNADAKSEARENAIIILKNLAKEEGIDILKYYAKAYLPTLIEKYITQNKTAGKIAKGLIPFSDGPELP